MEQGVELVYVLIVEFPERQHCGTVYPVKGNILSSSCAENCTRPFPSLASPALCLQPAGVVPHVHFPDLTVREA